jgi:hypothetical protein
LFKHFHVKLNLIFFKSKASFDLTKSQRAEIMKDRIYADRPCRCVACRFDYPTRDDAPIANSSEMKSIEMNFDMILNAMRGFPTTIVPHVQMYCDGYQQLYRAEEFPTREMIGSEGIIQNVMLVKCKFLSVWPLLRREFYDFAGRFLPSKKEDDGEGPLPLDTPWVQQSLFSGDFD